MRANPGHSQDPRAIKDSREHVTRGAGVVSGDGSPRCVIEAGRIGALRWVPNLDTQSRFVPDTRIRPELVESRSLCDVKAFQGEQRYVPMLRKDPSHCG